MTLRHHKTAKGLEYAECRAQKPGLDSQSYEEKATDRDVPERKQNRDQHHNNKTSVHSECECTQSLKTHTHSSSLVPLVLDGDAGVPEHYSHFQKSCCKKISKDFEDDEDGHLIYQKGHMLGARYEIVSTLGEGGFGKVVECIDHSQDDMRVALKILKNLESYRETAITEVEVLKQMNLLDSENKFAFVRMLDWFDHHGHICIVFELLGLSTFDFLKENDFMPYSVDQIRHMADQIFRAVNFLHQNKLTHTDLKPENVLFVDTDCKIKYNCKLKRAVWTLNKINIKVIDFGNATYDHEHHSAVVSTRHYRAPEIILDLGWTQACDVWSLGCILMEYYLGLTLFQTHNTREHLAMMQEVLGPIPEHILQKTRMQDYFHNGRLQWDENSSFGTYVRKHCKPLKQYMLSKSSEHEQLFDLLQKMMKYDVSKRITLEEAIKHPFFAQLWKK